MTKARHRRPQPKRLTGRPELMPPCSLCGGPTVMRKAEKHFTVRLEDGTERPAKQEVMLACCSKGKSCPKTKLAAPSHTLKRRSA